jgi:hypothetical protein
MGIWATVHLSNNKQMEGYREEKRGRQGTEREKEFLLEISLI